MPASRAGVYTPTPPSPRLKSEIDRKPPGCRTLPVPLSLLAINDQRRDEERGDDSEDDDHRGPDCP